MSDLISRSTTIESIKAEIQCVEKEKRQYFEQGNFHNGNILVEKIQAMKLVMKIVANKPTLDEKEIIRKSFERVLKRAKAISYKEEANDLDPFGDIPHYVVGLSSLKTILKEELEINE